VKRLYVYLYTCRKPSGRGRHFGYAGLTNRPDLRDGQHRASQPWSDLITRRRVWSIGRVPRFVGRGVEWCLIKATAPVYNVQHNRTNPRRIKPWDAREMRRLRDLGGRAYPRVGMIHLAPVALVLIAALYLWSR
jgi:hypothetical protein